MDVHLLQFTFNGKSQYNENENLERDMDTKTITINKVCKDDM